MTITRQHRRRSFSRQFSGVGRSSRIVRPLRRKASDTLSGSVDRCRMRQHDRLRPRRLDAPERSALAVERRTADDHAAAGEPEFGGRERPHGSGLGGAERECPAMSGGRGGADLRLSCQPSKVGGALLFPYTVENRGSADVYAMHALPSTDPATGEARANDQAVVVILGAEGDVILGKFAAPLPTDRRMPSRYCPWRHLPAGARLEGRIEIPIPLAETSPYFPDLSLRKYQVADISGLRAECLHVVSRFVRRGLERWCVR
jgi:hypothetical protein